MGSVIRVGLTLAHGMAREVSENAPTDVQYSFLKPHAPSWMIRSPIKGFMGHYRADGEDLIEAIMSPVLTADRWLLSCENLEALTAFSLLGVPLPRTSRVGYIRSLLMKDNCKGIVFWSQAGLRTLRTYGCLTADDPLLEKSTVVYPAVRAFSYLPPRRTSEATTVLFSGDFFRKGGVNVVDAFQRARQKYPRLGLTVCCDPALDFNTPNAALREEYLDKLATTEGITLRGRVPRHIMLSEVLPGTDIYLLPTYIETFGVTILEAMGLGIPIIATNHFAIPEMLEHGVSGLLIDTSRFDTTKMFRGYLVRSIPADFREHVTEELYRHLCVLVEQPDTAQRLGESARQTARMKFSFESRNERMRTIYERALS